MRRFALAILCAIAVASASIKAHHAHTDFALDRDVTLSGTIESVHFQNPHVLLVVRTPNSTFYTAEWQGAGWLQSHQELVSSGAVPLTSTTLKAGDRVVIVGSPSRDTTLRTVVNLKEVRRPSDGWLWSCRQPGMQQIC